MERDVKRRNDAARFAREFMDPASIAVPGELSFHIIRSVGADDNPRKPAGLNIGLDAIGAFIALKVAEGALQRLGGYIFDAIFPFFDERKQRELIERLATRFREILREEAVRRANVSLASLMNKMLDYNSQRGNQVDRLVDATAHAQDLVSELQSLGLQGFGAFLIGAGLQLAVIQARYWNPNTRDEGEKANALRHIRQDNDHVDRMITETTIFLSHRFGGVADIQVPDPWGGPGQHWYTYWLDGQLDGAFASAEDAQRASDQRYEEELNRLQTEVIRPALMVKAKWQELARQVPNWHLLLIEPVPGGPPTQ